MWKKFSLRGNYKWLDILHDLLTAYNNRKHRNIGAKPKDIATSNETAILLKLTHKLNKKIRPKFNIGDKVRVSKAKAVFEKGYTPN